MDIVVNMEKEYTLIRLAGRLEATQAPELTATIQKSLREGAPSLILDCCGMNYVASMGLRCFLMAQNETRGAGGQLIFFGLNDNVRSVFSVTGFDKIVRVRTSLEDALSCLG